MSSFQMGIISHIKKTREGWQFIYNGLFEYTHKDMVCVYIFLCAYLAEKCRFSSFFFCLRTNIPCLLNILFGNLIVHKDYTVKSSFTVEPKNKDNSLAIVQNKDSWTNLFKNSSTQPTRSLAFSHMLRSGLLLLPFSWLCFSFGTAALSGRPRHTSCVQANSFLVVMLLWGWHRLELWMSTKECTSDVYYTTVCCAGLRDHSLRAGRYL